VLGGMVTATALVLIFVPMFFVLIEKVFGRKQKKAAISANPSEVESHE
jgi:multidrug efflux pump